MRSFEPSFFTQWLGDLVADTRMNAPALFAYGDTRGSEELRDLLDRGYGLTSSNTLVTDGAAHALFLVFLAMLDTAHGVLLPSPALPAYAHQARLLGAAPDFYSWSSDPHELIASFRNGLSRRPKVIVLNTPHNPTGYTHSAETIAEILRLALESGSFLVFDDAYAWMELGETVLTRYSTLDRGLGERIAVLGSLGKFLCLPGLRLGVLTTGNADVLKAAVEAKRQLTLCSCPASENLATQLLQRESVHAARTGIRSELIARRQAFSAALARRGVITPAGACGFYAYAEDAERLDAVVSGISGAVFGGRPAARRYCLAISRQSWDAVLCGLATDM